MSAANDDEDGDDGFYSLDDDGMSYVSEVQIWMQPRHSDTADHNRPARLPIDGYGGVDRCGSAGAPAGYIAQGDVRFEQHITRRREPDAASSFDTTSSLEISSPPRSPATSLSPPCEIMSKNEAEIVVRRTS
ncbi:hypothetical protein EDD15DRAFT_2361251 [Pisolithus albus]|nr:hypothetical protein EDD15DRAFT_2361251 [Pisolithus albus]